MRIERFIVRCRAPRRVRVRRDAVEREVRGAVAAALSRRLATWADAPGVVRVRQVRVRVRLSLRDLAGGRFADAVAAAIHAAIAASLRGEAGEILRTPTRAQWLARFLADWLEGRGGDAWAYAEFEALRAGPPGAALVALAESEPPAFTAALAEMQADDRLLRILAACSEAELARLGAALSPTAPAQPNQSDLLRLATWAAGLGAVPVITPETPLPSFLNALQFWLGENPARRFTVEQIYHGLRALEVLCTHLVQNRPLPSTGASVPPAGPAAAKPSLAPFTIGLFPIDHAALRRSIQRADLPDGVLAWLRGAFAVETGSTGRALTHALATLSARLHPTFAVRAATTPAETVPTLSPPVRVNGPIWQETGAAGLLTLVAVIERLGWRHRALLLPGGARAWPFVFAGVAQTILGLPPAPREPLDPAVAIFAGWLGEPESAALLRFVSATSNPAPSEFLAALGHAHGTPGLLWPDAFHLLAAELLRAFASRLPGFAGSSRAFLLQHFLQLAGRLAVEERRVRVEIDFASHLPVLQLAGAGLPVEAVSWFGGRRLEIQLAGE